MSGGPLLSLSGIAKRFASGTQAIARVDLDVAEGTFLSLVGPSGCGKSTALRIIAGLLKPDAGTVSFPSGRPEMGFVFQEPTLMPWATVLGNARLPLDLKGVPKSESNDRAARALTRVGLGGFETAYPRELSGGMKMRVSIARAIAAEPKLLLMDEPFAALDELTRQALNDDLLKLKDEDALTVIFVTHSVYESTYLSSRVVVMTPRPGRVAADIALSPPPARDETYRLTPQFMRDAGTVSAALKGAMAS
ncbi:MAG TPA: ABC transporter ATP-binding protein [Rhizomicrobium sp.]|jgi:NitT/TauT family transport system ATP-binding protein|nr:ABC transporter ATP-binding protein [Rhizomicrobium sp.]